MTDVGATPVVTTGCGDSFGGGMGWWGFLILAMMFWGVGGNGGFGGGNGVAAGAAAGAVDADIWKANAFSDVQGQIRGITNGLADATFAINNSVKDGTFASVQAINGAQNALAGEIATGNFNTQRAIDATNFNIERNTAAIVAANTVNTQKVLDFLAASERSNLQAQLADSKQALSEARIIASMKPQAPIPAYTVQSPYAVNGCCGC